MAAYKIKKSARLRSRFIQSEALDKFGMGFDISEKLKDQIKTDSAFQLVGDKTIISHNAKTQISYVLVEVLGIPKVGFKLIDHGPCELLQYVCPESAFEIDFETLLGRASDLMGVITHRLEDTFHIVSDGLNLELHFFIQKDYIHS
jgi:hypothetical protein